MREVSYTNPTYRNEENDSELLVAVVAMYAHITPSRLAARVAFLIGTAVHTVVTWE